MKKLTTMITCVLVAASLSVSASAGVVGNKLLQPSPTPAPAVVGKLTGSTDTSKTDGRVTIENAPLYRGTISALTTDKSGNTVITLNQLEGTNFGVPTMKVALNNNTRYNFKKSDLKKGLCLEVYYQAPKAKTLDTNTVYTALGANLYFESASVNVNAIVESVQKSATKTGVGSITVKNMANNEPVVFTYGPETNFVTELANIKVGDKLNIFHRGIYTMSLPPQGNALEIRTYQGTTAPTASTPAVSPAPAASAPAAASAADSALVPAK